MSETTPEPVQAQQPPARETPVNATTPDDDDSSPVAAAQAEAALQPVVIEFEGHKYEIPGGGINPMALTYAAMANTTGDLYSLVLYMQELFGPQTWRDWCMRHETGQILEFANLVDQRISEVVGGPGN